MDVSDEMLNVPTIAAGRDCHDELWWGYATRIMRPSDLHGHSVRKEIDQYGAQRVRVGQERIFVISKERYPQVFTVESRTVAVETGFWC